MSDSDSSNSPKASPKADYHEQDYQETEAPGDDDLDKELMLAAADADARNHHSEPEAEPVSEPETAEPDTDENEYYDTPEKHAKLNTAIPVVQQKPCLAKIVAKHYNEIEEKGNHMRAQSRIFYLRKFHNWIKTMLIDKYSNKIKDSRKYSSPLTVLDMCCGKGGDLFKWRSAGIGHLVCTDIAEVSLDQCRTRYEEMKRRMRQPASNNSKLFTVEYIPADCSRVRLMERYEDPSIKFDMVSCQFAYHYSFESLPQADCMLRNAAECLAPGGYFIATIPNAFELVARGRKFNGKSFGNDLFNVKFDYDVMKQPPLFGARYHFQLDGVVNCPEFLVHVPTLQYLAQRHGLLLIQKQGFPSFFQSTKATGGDMLRRMGSLEAFPPGGGGGGGGGSHHDEVLVGTADDDYTHAETYMSTQKDGDRSRLGTLSKSEWEASSLYLVLTFLKMKPTKWNDDGSPNFI